MAIEENIERQLAKDFIMNTNVNVFLTGKAGTGKTTLLKEILKETQKNTVVVAPTGVAAINAGGVTIHSLFQLPTANFIPSLEEIQLEGFMNRRQLVNQQKIRKDKRKVIQEMELLVIDEISMVRADLLDAVNFTLKRLRKNPLPFGGVQLLVIGDLFQLAPVVREHVWTTLNRYYRTPFFFSSESWTESQSITIELKKIYRQEAGAFVDVLNNIRDGKALEKDIALLNERFNHKASAANTITLTTHNRKANAINQTELARLEGDVKVKKAFIKGQFYENSYPTLEEIQLKKGAQVMFIKNHPEGLYYNGKIGTVTFVGDESVTVKCEEDPVGIEVEPIVWRNIKYQVNERTQKVEEKEIGSFEQTPLKLAWAVTVHKSQGLTFQNVILDLEHTFAPGQLYVALSRCVSLEGIQLTSMIRPENVITDQRVLSFQKNNELPENIAQLLEGAKKKYEIDQLKNAWDLLRIEMQLEQWSEYLKDHDVEKKANVFTTLKDYQLQISKLKNTSKLFRKHIAAICSEEEDPLPRLKERVDKGVVYYVDILHNNFLVPIEKHRQAYRKIKNHFQYARFLEEVEQTIWRKVNELYELTFSDEKLFSGKRQYKQKSYFDPKAPMKPAPKQKKGSSVNITFELYQEGKTIDQIATERRLSVGTIQEHFYTLIKDKKVKIEDIMNGERLALISEKVKKADPEASLTAIKNSIGQDDVSFAEVRWVRWYMRNK